MTDAEDLAHLRWLCDMADGASNPQGFVGKHSGEVLAGPGFSREVLDRWLTNHPDLEHAVRSGQVLALDEAGDCYRPTVRGRHLAREHREILDRLADTRRRA